MTRLLWESRWWWLQTHAGLWAPFPLVHVSVRNYCFLFCLHMMLWGIKMSYPILCVCNQHIGGYHGSHGSKWIFGLIPLSWFSCSVTSVPPADTPPPSPPNRTTPSFFGGFLINYTYCFGHLVPSFVVTPQPKCSAGFYSACSATSLSSARWNREGSYSEERCRGGLHNHGFSWHLIKGQFTQNSLNESSYAWTSKSTLDPL